MPSNNVEELNDKFGIPDNLVFETDSDGLIYCLINNESSIARIFQHGSQITDFIKMGTDPALFLSEQSQFKKGKAIRGGIPISWPWFADHPIERDFPAHGFARTSEWNIIKTSQIDPDTTRIITELKDTEDNWKFFPYKFILNAIFTVGEKLELELITRNKDTKEFTFTSALHSYYNVGNIADVNIAGLENKEYIDKVDNYSIKHQEGEVITNSETDRIYLNTSGECIIRDCGFKRKIRIKKEGSATTVIWNPWADKAKATNDLGDQDYNRFICVETANVGDDSITLLPGLTHSLKAIISVENL